MSFPSLSRSRSPVLSIRTQPEDEGVLRAEIAAAKRTQYEIQPREPLWQSAFAKRDSDHPMRCTHRTVTQIGNNPDHLPTVSPINAEMQFNEPHIVHGISCTQAQRNEQRVSPSRQIWRRFTSRRAGSGNSKNEKHRTITSDDDGREHISQKNQFPGSRQLINSTITEDEEAHGYRELWPEEQGQGHNRVIDLSQLSIARSKRKLKQSMCGSLSSTKSFLRNASNNSVDTSSMGSTTCRVPKAPHIDDFDSKDHLRIYLNSSSTCSPRQRVDQNLPASSVVQTVGPAELSAGPVPVELEGNAPDSQDQAQSAVSRTSTPSIRDLPPYVDDKRFSTDIAKDHHSHNGRSQPSYVCNSCQREINMNDIHDFCLICDTRDRVFCIDCAKRGPCCSHELEALLRSCSMQSRVALPTRLPDNEPVENIEIPSHRLPTPRITNTTDMSSGPAVAIYDRSKSPRTERTLLERVGRCGTHETHDTHDKLLNEIKNVQSEFLREMNNLRKEQDLLYRDRELSLRAREIEARDQQTNLREREVLVQHRHEQFSRDVEAFRSCRKFTKNAYIGAQFQPASSVKSKIAHETAGHGPVSLDNGDYSLDHQINVAKVVAEVEACISGLKEDQRYIKSCTAQKRKKEGANGSTESTPATTSTSSEQARKTMSTTNSERDASQDDDEDNERRRTPKKHKQDSPVSTGPQLLFACPYAKHNPLRYSSRNLTEKNYRGCVGHFLTDISRLKQHLKRVHWQPETFCPRCYKEFDNSTKLAEHAGALTACLARECPWEEKMDKTQKEKIHTKKPRVPPETVWFDIYKILFPEMPLPKSPYVERDDIVVTPSSAAPTSSINIQASKQLSSIFNQRLDQHNELQDPRIRLLIDQALTASFCDLLGAFSLSCSESYIAGPSIIVSPISRSSSGIAQVVDTPPITCSENSYTDPLPRVPETFDLPQHTQRPQRHQLPKLNTALQIPGSLDRLSTSQSRTDSPTEESPTHVTFDVNILPHVMEDRGYDDECRSFEQGDDKNAMAYVVGPSLPSSRNKSVMSIDSGYGSVKHPSSELHRVTDQVPNGASSATNQHYTKSLLSTKTFDRVNKLTFPESTQGSNLHYYSHIDQVDASTNNFSYSNYLDPVSREDLLNDMGYLTDPSNPWSYP